MLVTEKIASLKKTVVYFEPKTNEELKKMAEEYIGDYKYTGYKKGSTITSFGFPAANVFDKIYIIEVYQNQSGGKEPFSLIIQKYNVDAVNITYGNGGIRQKINIGQLLSTNIKSTKSAGSETIFKAETTTYTTPIAIGELPTTTASNFSKNAPDYAILNQIDIDNNNISGLQQQLDVLNNEFYEKAAQLKVAEPRGYYTKTLNKPKDPEFKPVGLGFEGFTAEEVFASESTIAATKAIRARLVEIVKEIRLKKSSLENTIKFGQEDIDEAKSRGLDVSTREATYKARVSNTNSTLAVTKDVLNFDNDL